MSTFKQVAVINTRLGDIRDVVFVSNGKLEVPGDTANNPTNKGFTDGIPWSNVTGVSFDAYKAGVNGVKIVNFNSLLNAWEGDTAYKMTVRCGQTKRDYLVYSPAFAISDDKGNIMRDKFKDLMDQGDNPDITVTTNGDYLLYIEGKHGVDQVGNVDFSVITPWCTDATALTITAIADHADGMKVTTDELHALQAGDYVYLSDITWTTPPTAGDVDETIPYAVVTIVDTKNFTVGHVFDGATYGSGGGAIETVIAIRTACVEPSGTYEIVGLNAPGYGVEVSDYDTVTINYTVPVSSPPHGHNQYKDVSAVVYVNTELDYLYDLLEAISNGVVANEVTVTGITKADPAVVTSDTEHCLAVGDKVIACNATVNPTILNGNVFTVSVVSSDTEFSIEYDSTGWTDAETGCTMHVYNTSSYYDAR